MHEKVLRGVDADFLCRGGGPIFLDPPLETDMSFKTLEVFGTVFRDTEVRVEVRDSVGVFRGLVLIDGKTR